MIKLSRNKGDDLGDATMTAILISLGVGVLGFLLLRTPGKQIRMGQHLTRMTNIFEEVRRQQPVFPAAGGMGINSLPSEKQMKARLVFEDGVRYLKSYPRHEVTRELVKNALLAEQMGRPVRYAAIGDLLETLTEIDVALDMETFLQSYA